MLHAQDFSNGCESSSTSEIHTLHDSNVARAGGVSYNVHRFMSQPENKPGETTTNAALVQFDPPSVDELSVSLPDYEILDILGIGGMAAVYKARQKSLDRLVAIKILPNFTGPDEHQFAARFEREAKVMAQMDHGNIVRLYDSGQTEDGLRFIAMEFVDGADLHTALKTRNITVEHTLSWLPQVCDALQSAHDRGLIHRDIKPANIFISHEGTVKVGDFGLAKIGGRQNETSLTMTNVSMGTPDYAPPEALEDGVQVDHRGDIYALGVVSYEMITGKLPRGAWRASLILCEGRSTARFDHYQGDAA